MAAATVVLISLAAAGCSKNATGSSGSDSASSGAAPVALAGSVTFNQTNLAKLDAALKSALAGKDLS